MIPTDGCDTFDVSASEALAPGFMSAAAVAEFAAAIALNKFPVLVPNGHLSGPPSAAVPRRWRLRRRIPTRSLHRTRDFPCHSPTAPVRLSIHPSPRPLGYPSRHCTNRVQQVGGYQSCLDPQIRMGYAIESLHARDVVRPTLLPSTPTFQQASCLARHKRS